MFSEGRQVPFFRRHQAVGETGNVFPVFGRVVKVLQHRVLFDEAPSCTAEGAEHVVERKRMYLAQSVHCRKGGIPVGVDLLTELVVLFAGGRTGDAVAQPVVFVHRRIHVGGQVMVVVGRHRHIQSFGEKVAFAVFH